GSRTCEPRQFREVAVEAAISERMLQEGAEHRRLQDQSVCTRTRAANDVRGHPEAHGNYVALQPGGVQHRTDVGQHLIARVAEAVVISKWDYYGGGARLCRQQCLGSVVYEAGGNPNALGPQANHERDQVFQKGDYN